MKKLFYFSLTFFIFSILFVMSAPLAHADNSVTLYFKPSPPASSVIAGSSYSSDLFMDVSSGENVTGFDVPMQFDPSQISGVSFQASDLNFDTKVDTSVANTIHYKGSIKSVTDNGLSGAGIKLGTISFTASKVGSGFILIVNPTVGAKSGSLSVTGSPLTYAIVEDTSGQGNGGGGFPFGGNGGSGSSDGITPIPTPNEGNRQNLENCTVNGKPGLVTDFGCVPTDPVGFVAKFYGIGLGLIGGIALLFIIYGGYLTMMSQGDPTKLENGKSYIFYALLGLLLAIFGYVFIQIVIVNVLHVPGFA